MKAGIVVLAAVFALSGCKGDPKKDVGAGTAQGQVLPGSASDAMLPLDTVKSQAPLAPKAEGGEGSNVKLVAKPNAKSRTLEAPAKLDTPEAPASTPSDTQ